MKTGKETKPAGQIHRQQLFYWMGRAIDLQNKGRKLLSDALVEVVLEQLRGNLERGLWGSGRGFRRRWSCGEGTARAGEMKS